MRETKKLPSRFSCLMLVFMLGSSVERKDLGTNRLDIALEELNKQSGQVLVRGHLDFESRRQVLNAACTDQPAVIVIPQTDHDVSVAVTAARKAGMPISVRSGGHSYTCTNLKTGSVHIDMRKMSAVNFAKDSGSPTGVTATLQPGATWGKVLRVIPPTEYSYPHGQCKSVGVAGFLLGGGVNWLGTYNKYGYGAEHVLSMKAVMADGRIVQVFPNRTEVLSPSPSTIFHNNQNNLFFGFRGAGSSFGIVTEFKYIVHKHPETKPAILLVWADTPADLEAIQAAGQESSQYSVTLSLEFAHTFWKNVLSNNVYKIGFPTIMELLRKLGRKMLGMDSYPVFLTVTDISVSAPRTTDILSAVQHVKRHGVRLVLEEPIMHLVFHKFGEIIYEANSDELEKWKLSQYYLASFNFGSLSSHQSFQDIFFSDPAFGNKRPKLLESVKAGCDYCFWMIHYRNRQHQPDISRIHPISTDTSTDRPKTLDTNMVCMYKNISSTCSTLVSDIKMSIESKLRTTEPGYTKYSNFPSCSSYSDWAQRYWGPSLANLESIKKFWDEDDVFSHCQSIGSTAESGQTCCPTSTSPTNPTTPFVPTTPSTPSSPSCTTTSGKPCIFPFIHEGLVHNTCTLSGFSTPWCSTKTDSSGYHQSGHYGDCVSSCPQPQCVTVAGNKPNQACVFPFIFNNRRYTSCVKYPGPPWCSTKVTSNGVHISGWWGTCHRDYCPIN